MDDFFWWVESLARSLEWEDRARMSRAMQFTGASRRQERLEWQRQVTSEIGSDHESAVANVGGRNSCSQDFGHEPHEHGGADKQYSKNGERCDYPGCAYNYKKDCPTCGGNGHEGGDTNSMESCKPCDGSGRVHDNSITVPQHVHPEPAKPYQDQAKKVHDFGDGWSIKKTHTFGDLKYEGKMMTNCIQDDADGGTECEDCYGSGHCQSCEEGSNTCGECDGSYEEECGYCEGAGSEDCSKCEVTSTEENCNACGGKGHDVAGANCGACNGRGKHTVWHPGKQECSSCDGEGVDEDGDECYHCDGTKLEDCDDCGGDGKFTCQNCEGAGHTTCEHCEEGYNECWNCEGADRCETCDGSGQQGSGEGGPENYYKAYDEDDAQGFNRAPGGAYSLRDPDNVPHVSFLHGDTGDDPNHIHDVLGRENKHPKPEYQKKMMQYMRAKLPNDSDRPQLPGMEATCGACKGEKTVTSLNRVTCDKCNGGRREDCGTCSGAGRVPDDDPNREQGHTMEGDPIPNLKACDDCLGNGRKPCTNCLGHGTLNEPYKKACDACKGTGEPTIKIDWGYHATAGHHTAQELDDMISGAVTKPDVMLLGRHKTNPNEVRTFKDAADAQANSSASTYVKEKCETCQGTGKHNADPESEYNCGNCHGSKTVTNRKPTSQVFDLHAVPTDRIGEDRLEFDAVDHQGWKVKDGKGAKIDWDGGTKLDWRQLQPPLDSALDPSLTTQPTHQDHRRMRQGQPDYVNQVVPRVANRFGARCGHKVCAAKAWGPGHPEYDKADWDNPDSDNEGKYRFSTHPGHNEWDEDAVAEWSFEEKGQDPEDPSVPKFNCTHCGMIVPGPADASECPNCDQPWDDKDVAKCSVHGDSLWDHNSYPQRCNIGESLSSGGTLPDDKIISCPNKREPTVEDRATAAAHKYDLSSSMDGHGLVHDNWENVLNTKGRYVDDLYKCPTCQSKGWLRDPSEPPIPKEWMQGCRFDEEDLSDAAKFTKGQGELRIPQTVEKQPAKVRNNPEMS